MSISEPTSRSILSARDRLIVALDLETPQDSLALVDRLGESATFYKIGWPMVVQSGLSLIDELVERGKKVFLDLKIDDIEQTVTNTVARIGGKATFLTVLGNAGTARAAQAGRTGEFPKILQVTLLSSLGQQDLNDIFGATAPTVDEYVLQRAERSRAAGCDGLIASGETIGLIRRHFGSEWPIIVSPGIRPEGSGTNDHRRPTTPAKAIAAGSDYLVVGRPIIFDADPIGATERVVEEIATAIGE